MSWPARKSVLVPIDFTTASFQALEEALRTVNDPANVHVIYVLSDLTTEAEFVREALDDAGRDARARAALTKHLVEAGHAGVNVLVKDGSPGETIAETAVELGCDLIVMPSHGRKGLSRMILGSVAERVLRLAHCPVLVMRNLQAQD